MRDFHFPGRSPVISGNAMVATSGSLASVVAIDVLKNGGNAVDAAITAAAVLSITEPHMTGIGGDCFALISLADGRIIGLNGSGRASANADKSWLESENLPEIHPDSVHALTVPGAVDAWATLLDTYGTFTLAEALAPAIALARDGVPTGQRTAFDWHLQVSRLSGNSGSRQHFLLNGRAPRMGEVMSFPALATSLEKIASAGPEVFYRGELADDMVRTLKEHGSLLDHNDFAVTKASWCEPLKTGFAGRDIYELPPNGQGITTLISLNILKQFDLERHKPHSAQRWHFEIEAMKQATLLQHRHIADPKYMNMTAEELLSDELARQLAMSINPDAANNNPEAQHARPGSDTVYLCVVDHQGMAVSFINSIYQSFGSAITTSESGICLQN
ncbi:MAG TPA: gamma-glutamyltransferase, partial [Rhizobiales bacterium]|nr:gamma-glutamyltransferase [Hyphomicrobiales bacterium]